MVPHFVAMLNLPASGPVLSINFAEVFIELPVRFKLPFRDNDLSNFLVPNRGTIILPLQISQMVRQCIIIRDVPSAQSARKQMV
jgi:hypothetical protein